MCTDNRKGTDKALFIWAAPATAPPAANSSWTRFSVADAHNRNWKGDAIYKIDRTDPFATQSYTSLVPLAPRAAGQHELLVRPPAEDDHYLDLHFVGPGLCFPSSRD
eukprot:COSAG04_NODE_15597_length_527_cov_0.607477_1_plen_106_part_01